MYYMYMHVIIIINIVYMAMKTMQEVKFKISLQNLRDHYKMPE